MNAVLLVRGFFSTGMLLKRFREQRTKKIAKHFKVTQKFLNNSINIPFYNGSFLDQLGRPDLIPYGIYCTACGCTYEPTGQFM